MSNKHSTLSTADIVARGPRNRSRSGPRSALRPSFARKRAQSSGAGIRSLLKCGADASLYGVASGPYLATEVGKPSYHDSSVPPVPPRSCTLFDNRISTMHKALHGCKGVAKVGAWTQTSSRTAVVHLHRPDLAAAAKRRNAKHNLSAKPTIAAAIDYISPTSVGVALGSLAGAALQSASLECVDTSKVRSHSIVAGLQCVRPTSPAWESLFGNASDHQGRSDTLFSDQRDGSLLLASPEFSDLASFASFPLPPQLSGISCMASHVLDTHSGSLYSISAPTSRLAPPSLDPDDKLARRKGLLPPAKRLHSRSLSIFREAQQLDFATPEHVDRASTALDESVAELQREHERARALRALNSSSSGIVVDIDQSNSPEVSPTSFDDSAFQYSLTEQDDSCSWSARTRSSTLSSSSYSASLFFVHAPATPPMSKTRCRASTVSSCSRPRSPPSTSPPTTPLPPLPTSPATRKLVSPSASNAALQRGFAGPLRPLALSSPIQLPASPVRTSTSPSSLTSPYKSRRIRYVRSSVATTIPTRKRTDEHIDELPSLPSVLSAFVAPSLTSSPAPSSRSASPIDRSTKLAYTSWTPDRSNFTPVRIACADDVEEASPLMRRRCRADSTSSASSSVSSSLSSYWASDSARGSGYSSPSSDASTPTTSSPAPATRGLQSPCSMYSQLSYPDSDSEADGDEACGPAPPPDNAAPQPPRKGMRRRLDDLFAVSDDAEHASVHYAYAVRV